MVTVTVDTRSVDVNLDKFNEKYTSLAATKNVENRRKAHACRQQAEVLGRQKPLWRPRPAGAKSARQRPSACSASSWKRPARPS